MTRPIIDNTQSSLHGLSPLRVPLRNEINQDNAEAYGSINRSPLLDLPPKKAQSRCAIIDLAHVWMSPRFNRPLDAAINAIFALGQTIQLIGGIEGYQSAAVNQVENFTLGIFGSKGIPDGIAGLIVALHCGDRYEIAKNSVLVVASIPITLAGFVSTFSSDPWTNADVALSAASGFVACTGVTAAELFNARRDVVKAYAARLAVQTRDDDDFSYEDYENAVIRAKHIRTEKALNLFGYSSFAVLSGVYAYYAINDPNDFDAGTPKDDWVNNGVNMLTLVCNLVGFVAYSLYAFWPSRRHVLFKESLRPGAQLRL